MVGGNKIVFLEITKDYYNAFHNLKNDLLELQNKIDGGIIVGQYNEIIDLINNKVKAKMNDIISDYYKISMYLDLYTKHMDLLNKGFQSTQGFDVENSFFKDAKEILEREL